MKFWALIFCLVWQLCINAMESDRKKFMAILEEKRAQHQTGGIQQALLEPSEKQKKLLEGLVKTLQIKDPDGFYKLINSSRSDGDTNNVYQGLLMIAENIEKLTNVSQAVLEDQREQGVIDEKERRFNRCCIFYQEFKTAISFIVGVLGSGTVTATALITYFSTTCD